MQQIICKNLAVGYGGHIVQQNLNFSINAGDYFCIVGENGSGKSTLMKTLLGLQPALEGEILLGQGLQQRDIGYLPQQTLVQRDFPASVREIVLSGCVGRQGLRPFYSRAERQRAQKGMERMGISHLASSCYGQLSGGQQQRVLLARALCAASKVLLLDEPVAGLDPVVTEELYELIGELNRVEQMTIIMISHDIAAATTYASRLLRLGETVFCGDVVEYCEHADKENLDNGLPRLQGPIGGEAHAR